MTSEITEALLSLTHPWRVGKIPAMKTSRSMCEWLLYSILCAVPDAIDTVVSAVAPTRRPSASLQVSASTDLVLKKCRSKETSQPSDVDELSDEDILRRQKNGLRIHPNYAVRRVTSCTVSKGAKDLGDDVSGASEANAIDLVFMKTTIPVPRVRRVVKEGWDHFIIMDYIPGRLLAEVWTSYSTWKKIRVAFTLRRYIRQLRRLKAPAEAPPGPISADGPRVFDLPSILGPVKPMRGPFASYEELSIFFNKRCKMALDANRVPEDHPWRREFFDDSSPLVLSHMDLNTRNIIEGDDGRLWLIDWAWSGYYPPWFEYVAMHRQVDNEKLVGFEDRFWEIMVPFVCGPYFKQERWLDRTMRGLRYA